MQDRKKEMLSKLSNLREVWNVTQIRKKEAKSMVSQDPNVLRERIEQDLTTNRFILNEKIPKVGLINSHPISLISLSSIRCRKPF
jgi:hypothetical protein